MIVWSYVCHVIVEQVKLVLQIGDDAIERFEQLFLLLNPLLHLLVDLHIHTESESERTDST